MGNTAEYVGIGYCSNDHLAVVPFIPMDTKVQMKSHAILGGGPAGNSTAAAAVRKVYETYHPKVCGATMGVRGSMCFDGRDFVKVPAFPVQKVVDTTGCGDLFHTGFAVRYLETQDLAECQRFAAAVSAIKCRGLSGRPPSAPTRQEVEKFLAVSA